MLDFTAVRRKEMSYAELAAGLAVADLRRLTNEIIDYQLALLADCTDADVVFAPVDPNAHDAYAEDKSDVDLAWNLGHLIVHVTASVDVECPRAVREDSRGDGAGQGLAGDDDRLERGLGGSP